MKTLTACAAILVAITTTTLRADIIEVSRTDTPESFSIVLEFTPFDDLPYTTPAGANWSANVTIVPTSLSFMANLSAQHLAAPHGSPELAPNPNLFATVLSPLTATLSDNETLRHLGIAGHVDAFSASLAPKPGVQFTWILTLTGEHQDQTPAVPDTASTAILLSLALTTLGTLRRKLVAQL